MAVEWLETTIGELIAKQGGSVKTGPFGTTLKASEYSTEGVPLISVREVGYGTFRLDESTPFVPRTVTERLPEYILRTGDIVFGRKGAVDRSARINEEQDGWFLGSDGIRLRLPKTCDSSFVAYQVRNLATRSWLIQHATGTTMPSLNQGVIQRIPIILPPLAEQRAIAYILGTLDDKIELNRRTNETLEEMARAIFKSWFVDFDPVRAKIEGRDPVLPKHIADLFPNRFEDSELGKIPVEWESGIFGEVAKHLRRTIKPEKIEPSQAYIGLDHMPRKSIALGEWESAEVLGSNKYEFRLKEILFGKLRPYFHKVGIASLDGVCSTDILVVAPEEPEWFGFVLGHISSSEFVDYTNASSTGTKMPRTNWKDMSSFDLVIPPVEVARLYTDLVRPLTDRIVANIHESNSLSALRDTLLPKLLSGEIRVQEAEEVVEAELLVKKRV